MRESRKPASLVKALALAGVVALTAFGLDARPAEAMAATPAPAVAEPYAITSSAINRDPASSLVLASREYPIQPSRYVPRLTTIHNTNYQATPEAALAFRKMRWWAKQDGARMHVTSAYRSYDTQKYLYDRYVRLYGEAYAQRISALPGTSEHQLGLAIDVGDSSGRCSLQDCFADTATGRWIAHNAHRYGFIIRYPKGWESVTGYKYEPWHLRYVGVTAAKRMYAYDIPTFEHYSGALGPWVTKPTHRTTHKVWVRRLGGLEWPRVKLLAPGAKISVRGAPRDGWYPVLYTSSTYGRAYGWLKGTSIQSY